MAVGDFDPLADRLYMYRPHVLVSSAVWPRPVANSKPSLEGAGVMGSQSRRRCIGKDGLEYIHWIFASRSLVGAKYMHM